MSSSSDYLSLGLEKGLLTLRFNLGSGEAQLSWNTTRVDDGRWHRASMSRSRQLATLALDGASPVAVTSPGRLRQLNVRSGLYVGELLSLEVLNDAKKLESNPAFLRRVCNDS
ncbi:hypothetical protein HPB48_002463 [Haemaphysalis longicornis]|uniref:Laminin G domain-containing protein n=1 Tax=Haemaphysalis longicornis TaxID=44386 RepID=A0A9J6FY30_HAELO|nr:hypothetical protein HPB48_002463 [Haemaphysalis longicornis]